MRKFLETKTRNKIKIGKQCLKGDVHRKWKYIENGVLFLKHEGKKAKELWYFFSKLFEYKVGLLIKRKYI